MTQKTFLTALVLSFSLLIGSFLNPNLVNAESILCDFNGNGDRDIVIIKRGRTAVYSTTGKQIVKFEGRAKKVRCEDSDGDGLDEIIARINGRVMTYSPVDSYAISRSLRSVCKNIRGLYRGEIYKSIASHHITDQRASSTSFITLRNTRPPKNNCLSVYNKNGVKIHLMGRYFPTGAAYSSRYYGGHGCGDLKRASQVAALARSGTGTPEIYITSGTGNCARVPNANACYNSSAC